MFFYKTRQKIFYFFEIEQKQLPILMECAKVKIDSGLF